MKKLFKSGIFAVMLLVQFFAVSQTIPPDATQLENIQITNNTTSTTATKMVVQENTGVLNTMAFLPQDNIFIVKNVLYRPNDINNNSYVAGLLNASAPFTLDEKNNLMVVSTRNQAFPLAVGDSEKTYKYILINKGKGTYGVGGIVINPEDLELVSISKTTAEDIENNPSTQIIDTGANISGSNISAYVNGLSPAIALQSQSEGYVLFKVLNGTTPQTYLFLDVGGLYGLGQLQTTLSDFQLLDDEPTPTVPALEQVLAVGNTGTAPIIINIPNSLNNGLSTNGNVSGRIFQFGNGSIISPAGGSGVNLSIDTKLVYANTVGTTFTGRELPDADWVNAGLALKANDADAVHKSISGWELGTGILSTDLNAISLSSIRRFTDATANRPFDFGTVQTFRFASDECAQIAFNIVGGNVTTRKQQSGVWSSWGFRIANATESDQALAYGQLGTGWANYTDTVYTSGSPFSITSGTTSTLPNNAGVVINNQLPIGVTSFYNSATSKITPQNDGDYYVSAIRFKAQTTAPTAGYFDFGIDIGGALGVQFKETKIFAKGAGIEHSFSIVVPHYTGSTFVANGGLVKITSGNGNMTIYDISYQIDRTHKAK